MAFRNSVLTTLIISGLILFLSSCSEREEPTVALCSTLEADNALKEAEARLAAADISFALDEPGDLMTPEELIPNPAELGDAAKQANFEEAIAQLNITLAELEQQGESGGLDCALIKVHAEDAVFKDSRPLAEGQTPRRVWISGGRRRSPADRRVLPVGPRLRVVGRVPPQPPIQQMVVSRQEKGP